MDPKLLKNKNSIHKLFAILKALLNASQYSCEQCNSFNFKITEIKKDHQWIFNFITLPNFRGPPKPNKHSNSQSAA